MRASGRNAGVAGLGAELARCAFARSPGRRRGGVYARRAGCGSPGWAGRRAGAGRSPAGGVCGPGERAARRPSKPAGQATSCGDGARGSRRPQPGSRRSRSAPNRAAGCRRSAGTVSCPATLNMPGTTARAAGCRRSAAASKPQLKRIHLDRRCRAAVPTPPAAAIAISSSSTQTPRQLRIPAEREDPDRAEEVALDDAAGTDLRSSRTAGRAHRPAGRCTPIRAASAGGVRGGWRACSRSCRRGSSWSVRKTIARF